MNIYAELIGNYKKQRIKSLYDNKLYITTDYRNFNEGKIDEVVKRVIHTIYNPVTQPIVDYAKEVLKENGIEIPEV